MLLLYVMKTRSYIEKRKDENSRLLVKDHPVFMSVSFSGNRIIMGTGIKMELHAWDPELQRVKTTYPESSGSNAWLETLSDTAASALKAIQNSEEEPTSGQFRTMFRELKPKYSSGFFDVFYLFLTCTEPE